MDFYRYNDYLWGLPNWVHTVALLILIAAYAHLIFGYWLVRYRIPRYVKKYFALRCILYILYMMFKAQDKNFGMADLFFPIYMRGYIDGLITLNGWGFYRCKNLKEGIIKLITFRSEKNYLNMRIHPLLMKKEAFELRVSQKLLNFIRSYENLHDGDKSVIGLQPKLDARGKDPIWTVGWGHALVVDGKFATKSRFPTMADILPYNTVNTIEEADALLEKDITKFENLVKANLKIKVNQHQFDALVSHAYNCGISEGLYIRVNNRAEKALKEFWLNRYITSGGIKLNGLIHRRIDEYEIWLGINYNREYKFTFN